MSLSFSSFGKILEKTNPFAVDEVINLSGHILPSVQRDKNKLPMFSLFRRSGSKTQIQSYPFNSVSRDTKPALCKLFPEKSYEAKYSPKFDIVQCKSPSFKFGSNYEQRERNSSTCSQDYYIENYSSFRTMQRSTRSQTEKKSLSPDNKQCPKMQQFQQIQIGKPKNNRQNHSPDFSKYTNRKQPQKEFLLQYDLLGVNYSRINRRDDVGYVQFSKFTNKICMKQDRAETPPSIRLNYEIELPKKIRNIYIEKPTYPKLKPKSMLPSISPPRKHIKKSKELLKWSIS